ncbi:MAG: LPS export ABC transporter periplasmic protein LptC [Myxococcota bacterium]|nr:LPS export ABC transporter periplasmic protein LptC [Myxococcota bacterium]
MELRASWTASFSPVLILIAIVVFAGSAFAGVPDATRARSASATPPLDITGMTFVSSTTDEAEVVVHAERAQYRPDADIADLVEVRASVATGSEGRKVEIECDEGTLDLSSNSFWARGNVKGRTDDGREFSAPWVRYDHAGALLFTDAPVLLTESGTTLRGGGFRYFVTEERFRLLGGATVVQDQ